MKHQIRITVSKPGEKSISIAEFKKLSWIERLASRWFGKIQKVMVLVPEESVQSVEIKEVTENYGRQDADKGKAV